MNFDIKQVPFSRYGSYISFSKIAKELAGKKGGEVLYLRTIHGDSPVKEVFEIGLSHNGNEVPFEIHASPAYLRLQSSHGYVDICIADEKVVRIKGHNTGITLTLVMSIGHDNIIPVESNRWVVNASKSMIQYMLTPICGTVTIDAPWNGLNCNYLNIYIDTDKDTNSFEFVLEEFRGCTEIKDYPESFEGCVKQVEADFLSFLEKVPEVPGEFAKTQELAAYVNWASVVSPAGILKRHAMLMSKNWMTNVWSWDHCFNAIAMCYKFPELAWDQFMVLFDFQNEQGELPDFVNDNDVMWNFCKPPIHGWALRKMMARSNYIDRTKLEEIYYPLCRWTKWWFEYMDEDRDGIPQYNHGNDSGWDNGTAFTERPPIEGPDLSTFLIIQMEVLSDIAVALGNKDEGEMWKRKASELLDRLLSHSLRDGVFVAMRSNDHKVIKSQSLQLYIPILLGKRLPENVLCDIIDKLKNSGIITEFGLATEDISSSLYQADGYWRGPIWAPSTMLIVDGLIEAGEIKLARDICSKFAKLVSQNGFAENFNALTGEGLRDRAYTWTSSVFLILANDFLLENNRDGCGIS